MALCQSYEKIQLRMLIYLDSLSRMNNQGRNIILIFEIN